MLVAAVAVLALVAALAVWLDDRRTQKLLRTEVAQRLAEVEASTQAAAKAQTQLATDLRDAQGKLTLLEARIAESQTQQAALEALYRDLAPSRDEIALSEIEQVLLVASQQLQLAGNVAAALTALQIADAKLQRLERPQFVPLRRALSRDMDQLRAVPYVDIAGVSLKLDQAIAAVGSLPLAMDERVPAPAPSGAAARRRAAVDPLPARHVDRCQAARPHRGGGPPRRAARAAAATIFSPGEPAPAPSFGADRVAEPRCGELPGRSRRRGRLGETVFRHATKERAGAAGDIEAARRDADGRGLAGSHPQSRGAARAPARAGSRSRPRCRQPGGGR